MVTRPDIDVVVELFGGYEPAQSLILAALAAGKDVVTANKALLAEHGDRIFKTAAKHGRFIGFEASVGGGVPIIRTLREALAGDRQRAVYGIVNGTCNYILTTMAESGAEFADVLAEAQRSGLAEADPSLDVGGHDAAHKLCLLVTLAFGVALKPRQVHTEGITRITLQDIGYARELGFTVKLLAIAKSEDGAIEARVHPTMVPEPPFAGRRGRRLQRDLYSGRSAGLDDVLRAGRRRDAHRDRRGGRYPGSRPDAPGRRRTAPADHALGYPFARIKAAKVKPMDRVVCEYYLRFMAEDKPGVLGRIASVLGRHKISMASVIQQERAPQVTVPVVMRTHECEERNLEAGAGRDSPPQDRQGGTGLHPHRGAIVNSRWPTQTKANTPRLSRWPGLIEHYRRFLPVTPDMPVVTLNEGNTPLIEASALAERIGSGLKVYLKFEGLNPTGSFKDRGMTMAISKALAEGARAVICASTGNTAASAAAYAGRAGLKAFVLIPKGAVALGKLSQSVMHGAQGGRGDRKLRHLLEDGPRFERARPDPDPAGQQRQSRPDPGPENRRFRGLRPAWRRPRLSFPAGRQCRQYHRLLAWLPRVQRPRAGQPLAAG